MDFTHIVENQETLTEKMSSRQKPLEPRLELYNKYATKISINDELTRQLVSFQANKKNPFYRWFKYKEAFSSDLVAYLLKFVSKSQAADIKVLDPFAGAGSTLTVASSEGHLSTGIEIMPVGVACIKARLLGHKTNADSFFYYLEKVINIDFRGQGLSSYSFPHLPITEAAFPEETEKAIAIYVDFLDTIEDEKIRYLFWFACLSILEDISYTRKDGQYLRWDLRSNRKLKSSFNKGVIKDFRTAIISKLTMMLEDITSYGANTDIDNKIDVIEGSCLDQLPKLASNSMNLIITSPPYANRYDYTRTYALELAFMGYKEEPIKKLRQDLLSCTVENKSKRKMLSWYYDGIGRLPFYQSAVDAFENQEAVQEILKLLKEARDKGELNNTNIPNLVENYLFEMNLVIRELKRILKPSGVIFMVNDNVRYHGEEVPVDLILSDFASSSGLSVDHIWLLQRGKGNSSQQMGVHGRSELRKCVYLWSNN